MSTARDFYANERERGESSDDEDAGETSGRAATGKIMIEIKPLSEMRDRGRTNSASLDDFTFAPPPRARGSFGSVTEMGDALETCERIFTSPVPLVYTRHTARFLSCWLLLLPLALWEPFGTSWTPFGSDLAVVPATTLVAIFFFGIEELAVQLEEPFSILPLSKLCDSVWDGGLELFDEPEPCENNPGSKVAKADAVQIGG